METAEKSTPFSAYSASIIDYFFPISLQDNIDQVGSIKPSLILADILPTSMHKSVSGSIGPRLVSIINNPLQWPVFKLPFI